MDSRERALHKEGYTLQRSKETHQGWVLPAELLETLLFWPGLSTVYMGHA